MKKHVCSLLSRLFVLAGLLAAFQPSAQAQDSDLASTLESEGNFTTLLAALQDTGLITGLQDTTQQLTLFAPTDDAFVSLPEGTLSEMDADQLKEVLSYHLVSGNVSLSDAAAEGAVTTAQGADLTIEGDAGSATVDGAAISEPDLQASNGTIHVIDAVLLPAQEGAAMKEEEPAMPPEGAPEEDMQPEPPQPDDPPNAPQPTEPPQR